MYTWTDRNSQTENSVEKMRNLPGEGGGAADYIDAVVLCDKGEYSVDKCCFPSKSKARAKSF